MERNVLPRGPRGTKRASFLRQIPLVDAYPPEDKDAGGRTRKKEEETEEDTPTRARSLIMYIYPYLDPTPLRRRSQAREYRSPYHYRRRPHPRRRCTHMTIRISWSPTPSNPQLGPSCTKVNLSIKISYSNWDSFFFSPIYFFHVVLTYSLSSSPSIPPISSVSPVVTSHVIIPIRSPSHHPITTSHTRPPGPTTAL